MESRIIKRISILTVITIGIFLFGLGLIVSILLDIITSSKISIDIAFLVEDMAFAVLYSENGTNILVGSELYIHKKYPELAIKEIH